MLTGLKLAFAAALGIVLGLAATDAAVDRGLTFATLRAGPWVTAQGAGSGKADPYEQASLARRAEIPLGLGEGLTFLAGNDSLGSILTRKCEYLVAGEAPAARYWTLTLITAQGRLVENPARRYGFTSSEIVREANGDFAIAVSQSARPGNWLPIGSAASEFVLMLRLYDSPMAATASTLSADDMPKIARKHCS